MISNKQQRFIDEYLIDLNATQAAIRAGYSKKCARQLGQRMLTNVDIKAQVDGALAKYHDRQRKQLMLAADKAISALIDATESGSGSVRVSAANSILDRAGHKANDKWIMELIEELKRKAMSNDKASRQEALEKLIGHLSKYSQQEENSEN